MEVFYQSAVDIETSEYSNAEQPEFFKEPTQGFFTVQPYLVVSEEAPTVRVPYEQQIPRPHVIESLERSLAEHRDVWAELAGC